MSKQYEGDPCAYGADCPGYATPHGTRYHPPPAPVEKGTIPAVYVGEFQVGAGGHAVTPQPDGGFQDSWSAQNDREGGVTLPVTGTEHD